MKSIIKYLSLIFTMLVLFNFSGCKADYTGNYDNSSTTCGNIVMGNGKFAVDNGFIYFTDRQNIYEYDIETKKTVFFSSKDDVDVRSIFVQDKYIYFASDGLNRITRDGKKQKKVFGWDSGSLQLYIEGYDAYYLNSIEGSLFLRDLENEVEKELFQEVLAYFVDSENVYVVAKVDGQNFLYTALKSNLDFSKTELSFKPIAVFSDDESLYLAEQSTYQVIKVSSAGEERLPIYSCYYQVLDGNIIYLDSTTFKNSCFDLKIYDVDTKKSKTVCEGVFDFNVLDNKYVGIQCGTGNNSKFLLYDIASGETELMYINEE